MYLKHFFIICLTTLCLAVPSSWCAADESAPIRIGATVSLEGKYVEPSKMLRDGFRLWQKQVNEGGGLLGRQVELLLYDDKSSPELVSRLYEKLITEDKVDLVLPPYSTQLTLAAAEVTSRHGYLVLACGASGDEVWSRGFKNVFGIWAPAGRYFIGLLDIMASNGMDSVAIVYEDNSFTRDMAVGTREWAEKFGLKVSLFRSFVAGSDDLSALVKEVQKEKPDGLILSSYPNDSYLLMRLLETQKYRPRVLGLTIASAHPDFYLKAGSFAEGVFGSSQWEPNERIPFPGARKFISDFSEYAKGLPSYHSGSAYAGCQIIERAIRNCACLDQARMADYIRSLDTVTIAGRFKVDQDGRQIGHNSVIIQWQNGKKQIVFPASMQTAQPKL